MAEVAEKLYPPTIGRSIPAFYRENNGTGAAKISVPFSMNRAVGENQIKGFSLLIKTIQSNSVIGTILNYDTAYSIKNNMITFFWDNENQLNLIKIGQYLKIQIAYIALDNTVGYYSTIGIIKYTSKPTIYIDGMSNNENNLIFKRSYIGVYKVSSDKSERPYSYQFCLYDNQKNLVETSGWRLHNTEISELGNAYTIDQITDTYTFEAALIQNQRYYITYSVKTINNLIVTTNYYPCMDMYGGQSILYIDFIVENNFEEGYINVQFKRRDGSDYQDDNLSKAVSIAICRADNKDNFESWRVIKKVYFSSYHAALNWEYKDFTVEHGVSYKYSFQQYNSKGFYSERVVSDEVYADFEDMFLWDGEKQLKIRFNPKVSSFKTTLLQQKVDTIGNKFPFIFRNGFVEYKEFPIAGLISYWMDNNEMFIDYNEDLKIQKIDYPLRQKDGIADSLKEKIVAKMPTQNLLNYNIYAERVFKNSVLDWLNNGEIKLFRSPNEGNYLVRLINVSLTPEDRVGRMLHSFTSTAYEMADFTYENLINYGFITTNEPEAYEKNYMSIYLEDALLSAAADDAIDVLAEPIKINTQSIVDHLKIDIPIGFSNKTSPLIFRFIYQEENNQVSYRRFMVQPGSNLEIKEQGEYPDLYFSIQDNFPNEKLQDVIDKIKAVNITYEYINKTILTGSFNNIESMYVSSCAESYFGPNLINNFSYRDELNEYRPIKFFKLTFHKKEIKDIYSDENISGNIDFIREGLFYYKNEFLNEKEDVTDFSPIYLYRINDDKLYSYKDNIYEDSSVGIFGKLIQCQNEDDLYTIRVNTKIDQSTTVSEENANGVFTLKEIPLLDLSTDNIYEEIYLSDGVYMDCAYLEKITQFGKDDV